MAKTNGKSKSSGINTRLLWEQLLRSKPGPSNAQLCHLVIRSRQMGDLAFKQLLTQNPSRDELFQLVRFAQPKFREAAFKHMAENHDDIYQHVVTTIIQIEQLRESAWKKFLEMGPKEKEIRLIADMTDSLREECWGMLLSFDLSNEELMRVMTDFDSLREKAWEMFKSRDYSNWELCRIIVEVKPVRKEAWQLLLKRTATNSQLCYLIDRVPSIKPVAEYKLYRDTADVMRTLKGIT